MTTRLHRGDLPDISRYKGAVAIDTETMGLDPVSYTHLDVYKRQALDRALGKQRAERGVVEPGQVSEARRAQNFARGEFRFASSNREFVPWTNRQRCV